MKPLLLLAVAAFLAGCAQPDNETADPGGPDLPDATDCMDVASNAGSGASGGQGFAIQQGHVRASHACIDLVVDWRACNAGFCANATARNNGTATMQVSSICQSPWEDHVTDEDGKPVQHREEQVTCLAFGRAPFAPGDVAYGNFSWDGRTWSNGKPSEAPAGQYTWTIVFWWDDGEGDGRDEVPAGIPVLIGIPT